MLFKYFLLRDETTFIHIPHFHMPASRKKRGRDLDFDEYVPPNPSRREDPAPQERYTHYELHGRAKHSLITVPASPPSYLETDDFDGDRTADEHQSYPGIEENEDQEQHNCELEALGLGEILGQTLADDPKKRRRTQAVSSFVSTIC
jgi:hypothetical protein